MEPITPLNSEFISPEPNSGCWLWIGTDNGNGYGRGYCRHTKRTKLAHRLVWETHHGPVPIGLQLDHLCRTKCCVNPAHLEPVTPSVNVKRGFSPKRARDIGRLLRAAVTHCPHGHEYTPANTYHKRDHRFPGVTSRCCRACNRITSVERRAKRKGLVSLPAGEGSR